jgi:tetratricopeptide (TPR) repeat protein
MAIDEQALELTRRERDVLVALCRPAASADVFVEPASVREIARALVVTDAAVKQHLAHLYDKFAIGDDSDRRRMRLAREALRRGAVTLPELAAASTRAQGRDAALAAGRKAAAEREWERAFELLGEADAAEPLGADDLEHVGEAGYFTNRHQESLAFQQRAYQAHLDAGDTARAAYMAVILTIHNANRMSFSVANGWLAKAERLLADEPECFAHGHVAVVHMAFKEAAGDWSAILELARQVFEIGGRCADPDLQALGLAFQGLALTHQGDVAAGMRLLDEAMASAVAGELTSMPTGIVYCRMLCACVDLHDFGRAGEWTEVIDRCATKPGLGGLPGDCRTHRAGVLLKRGAWAEGTQEASRAIDEAARLELSHVGIASRDLGEMRLCLGDIEGAEEAFARAQEYGISPEPGLALQRLVRGEPEAARKGLETALDALGGSSLQRARLLPAHVEATLAAGDEAAARASVGELEETAETYGVPALLAAALHARGMLELATGATAEAVQSLTSAQALWQRVDAPYEIARAHALLAKARLAAGDSESALIELRAARSGFERLGAQHDLARIEQLLAELTPA